MDTSGRSGLTRRGFCLSGMAAMAAPLAGPAAAAGVATLEARPGRLQLAPAGYPETEVWGYDGRSPGPVLRARQGDRFARRLVNRLPAPTTVHWHGLRIDNAMDGVPGLTQPAVQPGESFDYAFDLPDAGTYWYHAHEKSTEQVARGLYGVFVVEEPEPPEVDGDEVLVLDDWRLDPETAQIAAHFEAPHDRSHAGRIGNLTTTNGAFDLSRPVRRHERLRLRLVNAANARIFVLALDGLEGWTVALDGMPLAAPEPVTGQFLLGPGQRADLIVNVTAAEGAAAHLVSVERGEGYAQVSFPVSGSAAARPRPAPAPLPPNPRQDVPGLADARRTRLHMQGGAMGWLDAAVLDGRRMGVRHLAAANQFWAFNSIVGRTETPLLKADRGETVQLEIRNDTAFPHAMHLHGMHFREVLGNGGLGPLRDTLLSRAGETREIAFVADNPGDWLLHCHMLSHAAAGMSTWLRVA